MQTHDGTHFVIFYSIGERMKTFVITLITLTAMTLVACNQDYDQRPRRSGFVVDTEIESAHKRSQQKLKNLDLDIKTEESNIRTFEQENKTLEKQIEKIDKDMADISNKKGLSDTIKTTRLNAKQIEKDKKSEKIAENLEAIESNKAAIESLRSKTENLVLLEKIYADKLEVEELSAESEMSSKDSKRLNYKLLDRIDNNKISAQKNINILFTLMHNLDLELSELYNNFEYKTNPEFKKKTDLLQEVYNILEQDIKDVAGRDYEQLLNQFQGPIDLDDLEREESEDSDSSDDSENNDD